MKLEIEQDFLDITVLTAEENLLQYILNFQFEDLGNMESELCELRCRISEKRDILFNNWIKERTPRVRFSEIKSSDNEVIPEHETNEEW